MNKFWRILTYEYSRHVLRKRFLFALLSVPIIIAFIGVVAVLAIFLTENTSPFGYLDYSGLLSDPRPLPPTESWFDKPVQMIRFNNESDAYNALTSGDIQAFYVLEKDYRETANTRLVYMKEPGSNVQSQFRQFVRINLLVSNPPQVVERLVEGTSFEIQSLDKRQRMGEDEWYNILVPLFAGIIFLMVILSSGGYLLQAVVEEKENRTMEIIVTSVSPDQLIAGKIAGNIAVGLTQLLVWILFIIIAILATRDSIEWVRHLSFSWDYLGLMLLVLLPSFILVAAIMAAIGATVTETREAQQISGLFTLPISIPFYFTYSLMTNPNGPLAVALSFFPLTAPVAIPMRAGFGVIPGWQLTLNIILLVVFAVLSVWLASRTFRIGMLSYGKRLSLTQIFGKAK